jgi:hypothetical protein
LGRRRGIETTTRSSPVFATALRRALVVTHRWLGIAGGLLCLLWFVSGIAMVWARMPELEEAERLRLQAPIDLSTARIGPAEALRARGRTPEILRIAMFDGRPVYRFPGDGGWETVFADDGSELEALDANEATRIARGIFSTHSSTLRYDRRLTTPDQWTLQHRASLPAHRISIGDDDTWAYLSERSGELFLTATRSERRAAYVSAVPHWLYFTPLRRHGPFWNQLVIVLSVAGCVLTLTGLIWGVWQLTRASNARAASPYVGLMRWHHYAGLVFGLVTFTWLLSGALSMEPWDWHASRRSGSELATAIADPAPAADDHTLTKLSDATAALTAASTTPIAELDLLWFRGEPYWRASSAQRSGNAVATLLVPARHPETGTFARFSDDDMIAAARAAMPDATLTDTDWLSAFDAYYYDLHGPAPLPALRARFDDEERTWLYLDPASGTIVRRERTATRVNRWIYHGLHSFDFPFLLDRPALRYAVIVLFSLGGIAVIATSFLDGWRRVARLVRRVLRPQPRLG